MDKEIMFLLVTFIISFALFMIFGLIAANTKDMADNAPLNKAGIDYEQVEPEEFPYIISSSICVVSLVICLSAFIAFLKVIVK